MWTNSIESQSQCEILCFVKYNDSINIISNEHWTNNG